jgi:hypothetical protein
LSVNEDEENDKLVMYVRALLNNNDTLPMASE